MFVIAEPFVAGIILAAVMGAIAGYVSFSRPHPGTIKVLTIATATGSFAGGAIIVRQASADEIANVWVASITAALSALIGALVVAAVVSFVLTWTQSRNARLRAQSH